nr:MAG TPA: hypothetical protein [Caudoviricetes sp.]DAZ79657.1 MAG TPA: hypothetical protein [Caudoviricetes sp.]
MPVFSQALFRSLNCLSVSAFPWWPRSFLYLR